MKLDVAHVQHRCTKPTAESYVSGLGLPAGEEFRMGCLVAPYVALDNFVVHVMQVGYINLLSSNVFS